MVKSSNNIIMHQVQSEYPPSQLPFPNSPQYQHCVYLSKPLSAPRKYTAFVEKVWGFTLLLNYQYG